MGAIVFCTFVKISQKSLRHAPGYRTCNFRKRLFDRYKTKFQCIVQVVHPSNHSHQTSLQSENQHLSRHCTVFPHHDFDPFGVLLLQVVYSHQVWMRPGLNMKLSDHMEHKKPNVKGRNVTLTRNLFLMVNCCLCMRCSFSYEKVLNRKKPHL